MQNNENYGNISNKSEQGMEWEDVKTNIFPCLAPVGWIDARLKMEAEKQIAHSGFFDLAAYYYIKLKSHGSETEIAWISHEALKGWGISMQTLETQALENMAGDGYAIQPIEATLKGDFGVELASKYDEDVSLYVLTNRKFRFGAAGILDKRMISEFAEKIGKNLYILPSSLHEILIYPDFGKIETEELEAMVREVNATQVEPCERLANHIYYYDRATDEIRTEK